MAHPIHVLQRRSEAVEIANLTALVVVDAQERGGAAGVKVTIDVMEGWNGGSVGFRPS